MPRSLHDIRGTSRFPTTSWSMVMNAGAPQMEASQEALSRLCTNYWYPVYAFIRRKGFDADQAPDLTQEFFTRLIEKDYLADVDRSKGRFRSFLLASVTHFLSNWVDAERTLKRGGGRPVLSMEVEGAEGLYVKEPSHSSTPEILFEYNWALTLLDRALKRLATNYPGADFKLLKPFLLGEADRGQSGVAAQQLGVSEGAFKVAVHRLRKRYRDALRAEIADTVADPAEIEEEIRYLLAVFARGTS